MSSPRESERAENGVAGDMRLLLVETDERLGDGLGAANGLFDL